MLPPRPNLPSQHVHVDVALERGSVGDRQARCLDVSDEPPAGHEIDPVARGDVAGDLAADRQRRRRDVGLDHGAGLDADRVFGDELAAERALDDARRRRT